MSLRVCTEPSCPRLVPSGRCDEHRAAREKARGTRQQRGYDAAHMAERARWTPIVATGHVTCWRCGQPIPPGAPWDLGHDDHDRTRWQGPEHRQCNRATAGRR